ncbi:MAG: hypothetical protein A2W91_02265 [Bacteroidetes bacterium GWF2_38_335]|nr:MAG: hypothetical protein A2W91_02265 [Bacteroidetes bacterium GWF2_38_335]OFY80676.1 MAG: hypothetical protein A2281_05280 [Bacteroidetes bacterium RIFOXYA12_FULL_38_20]HBS87019.1 hypothetical protein [Bacteroidales bacterium]
MGKIKLHVLGLSYSQTQSGAYALVLSEEGGERRIPIIIGGFEAQAIAIELEGLNPPRPLTHDLFLKMASAFEIRIKEVNIIKLEEGVFYSELIFIKDGGEIRIDARTSDAVALALRFKCPIYTSAEIMEKAGIVLDFNEKTKEEEPEPAPKKESSEYGKMPLDELQKKMDEAVSNENYELASKIKKEIEKRSKT